MLSLRGGDGAAWIAAVAAGLAPVLLGVTATLNTTTFEPLAWTVVAYGVARAAILDDRRALVWAGIAAGIALQAKYTLPLWLLCLAAAVALFPERRILRMRELWLGLGLAAVIAAPSIVWQATHGLPFRELVRAAADKDIAYGPLAYAVNQVLLLDPLFAPIWLAGLAAPFVVRDLRAVRFLPVAFAFAAVAIVAEHGKDYYLAPAYPPLFALGGILLERAVRNGVVRIGYLGVAAASAFVLAPLALPILPPATLVAYQRAIHLAPAAQEHGDDGDVIPPTFADMLGWHDFVRQIGTAYVALPPAERANTGILVDNYGEAAALDVYGAPYGLPPALSGHNQYAYWGARGQDPANILRVQLHPERLRPYCRRTTVVGTTQSFYARDFENGRTIAFCEGLHPRYAALEADLRDIR